MIGVMSPHLIIAPVLLPVLTAALMLALGEQRRETLAGLNVGSCLVGLALSILLAWSVHHGAAPASPGQTPGSIGTLGIYLPANWPTPFGIVLVLDRLSSAMLLLTSVMATAALIFAVARWDRIGVHFHPLFQIQLMGLNGAFLTGDLFNLFVFFEVLLAASYGLLLHGPGRQRVGAGLHYIAINLVASSFFLVGAAMLYGVTGTLNMADLAVRIPEVAAQDQAMLHAGVAILGMAFLTKAAVWPMGFWLVPAYSAAGAPVAALFSIMTKVGIYAILRLWSLGFSGEEGTLRWGADWLVAGGLATVAFGQVDDRVGSRKVIVGSLVAMCSLGLVVFLGKPLGPATFWIFGLALCVFVGPVQAASRSYLARITPRGSEGEMFGLYATTGRAVSFLAPFMYSSAITLAHAVSGRPKDDVAIFGILGLVAVLLAGLLAFLPVKAQAAQARDDGDRAR